MAISAIEKRIEDIVSPIIADLGGRLVQVDHKNATLQIMVEGADGTRMGVDDFAKISREISPVLEVEDPIAGAYSLEISSPGIDRPLKTAQDFENFAGFDVKIEINPPIEGQKRFRGIVNAVKDGYITVTTDTGDIELEVERIEKAKLVLTDELIAATKDKLNDNNANAEPKEEKE